MSLFSNKTCLFLLVPVFFIIFLWSKKIISAEGYNPVLTAGLVIPDPEPSFYDNVISFIKNIGIVKLSIFLIKGIIDLITKLINIFL